MARIRCAKCGYVWVRRQKISRGQLIGCPNCGMVLGKMSKPIKPHVPIYYTTTKAIDEYAKV